MVRLGFAVSRVPKYEAPGAPAFSGAIHFFGTWATPPTKLPDGYGLWDMLGNVWEWVQDASKEHGEHILKGGSFYNSARDVRVSGRLSAPPDLRHRDIGFRCASSAWPEERV
jgi:formylglycine-generating enzyme required for sulfatase activity